MIETIFSWFDFNYIDFPTEIYRFLLLLVLMIVIAYLSVLIISKLIKNKEKYKTLGFTNALRISLLYGIIIAFATLSIIIILTLHSNGLYYFTKASLTWSWYCGYLLLIPEFILIILSITAYFLVRKRIINSIN